MAFIQCTEAIFNFTAQPSVMDDLESYLGLRDHVEDEKHSTKLELHPKVETIDNSQKEDSTVSSSVELSGQKDAQEMSTDKAVDSSVELESHAGKEGAITHTSSHIMNTRLVDLFREAQEYLAPNFAVHYDLRSVTEARLQYVKARLLNSGEPDYYLMPKYEFHATCMVVGEELFYVRDRQTRGIVQGTDKYKVVCHSILLKSTVVWDLLNDKASSDFDWTVSDINTLSMYNPEKFDFKNL